MPKKYKESHKLKWLDLFNSGKTEKWIANNYKCDVRTIKKGIEEARRKQDVVIARRELVKDALRKHQNDLLDELDRITTDLFLPPEGYVAISWGLGGDSILEKSKAVFDGGQLDDASILDIAEEDEERTVRRLLKEHLKNDRLWRILAQYKKTYAAHLTARIILQRKIVAVIQDKTGCKLVDRNDVLQPFLYTSNTGDLFLRAIVRDASGAKKKIDIENGLIVNIAGGDVRYNGTILGEVPGKEEEVKAGLIKAFKELRGSYEAVSVVDSYKALEAAQMKVRQAVEQFKLLGLISGQCEICRRLGI